MHSPHSQKYYQSTEITNYSYAICTSAIKIEYVIKELKELTGGKISDEVFAFIVDPSFPQN